MAVYITVGNINDNMPVISVNGSTDAEEVAVLVEEAQLTGLLVFVVEVLIILKHAFLIFNITLCIKEFGYIMPTFQKLVCF